MRRPNLALIAGIFLACISLWFSATGLVHLFSGAGIGIILMAIGFEMAKISGVTWLIRNGKKNLLSAGLALATVLLTTVSSLGIYGYLGRAYSSGRSSSVIHSTVVGNVSSSISALEADKNRLYSLIEAVPAAQGTNRRRIQAQTQPKIDQIDAKIAVLRDSLSAATTASATISNDIGDLRFAADLFGTTQEDLAKLIVTALAFLLDPLAVMLVLASGAKGKRVQEEAVDLSAHHTGFVGDDHTIHFLDQTTKTGRIPSTMNESAPPRDYTERPTVVDTIPSDPVISTETVEKVTDKRPAHYAPGGAEKKFPVHTTVRLGPPKKDQLSPALTTVIHRRKTRSP